MTDLDLDAIPERLFEEATPLPWTLHGTSTLYMNGTAGYFFRQDGKPGQIITLTCHQGDAALIETAVNALPVLLDEVRHLRGQRDAARKLHWEYEGRCANCITWCDCDSDIVDRHQHNVPWPCSTAKALGGTDA